MAIYVIAWPFSEQLFSWLKDHLLPCPFKYFTHIDCPGCGFQRSFLALLQGDWQASFQLYPPTIPLLCAFIYFTVSQKLNLDNKTGTGRKAVFIIAASIVMVSYIIKMWNLHLTYSAAS